MKKIMFSTLTLCSLVLGSTAESAEQSNLDKTVAGTGFVEDGPAGPNTLPLTVEKPQAIGNSDENSFFRGTDSSNGLDGARHFGNDSDQNSSQWPTVG